MSFLLESLRRHKPTDRPGFQNSTGAHTDAVLATLARKPARGGVSIGRLFILIVAACVFVVVVGAWLLTGSSPLSLGGVLRPTMTAERSSVRNPSVALPTAQPASRKADRSFVPPPPAAGTSPVPDAARPTPAPDARKATAATDRRLTPNPRGEETTMTSHLPAVERTAMPRSAAPVNERDGKRLAKKPAAGADVAEASVTPATPTLVRPATRPIVAGAEPAARVATAAAPEGNVTRSVKVLNPTAPSADEFKLAVYYHRAGEFEEALLHYRAFIEQEPLSLQAHNNLGLLYQSKGLLQDAIKEFKRAITIDQLYTKAHNNLGVTLLDSGSVDAAAAEFRWLLGQDPKNVDAMVNLALAEQAGDHIEKARETLLTAINLKQNNAAARYNLALIYEGQGEYARAIEHYEAFLKYASADQAGLSAEVRGRLQGLRQKHRQGQRP